jgi:predicted nucleotidyltransferase
MCAGSDLFGSAVGTGFDPSTSDSDFLVEFGSLPKGGYSEHYFGLIEDLTALFGRPVDLLVARAVRNPTSARASTRHVNRSIPARDARKYLHDIAEAAAEP